MLSLVHKGLFTPRFVLMIVDMGRTFWPLLQRIILLLPCLQSLGQIGVPNIKNLQLLLNAQIFSKIRMKKYPGFFSKHHHQYYFGNLFILITVLTVNSPSFSILCMKTMELDMN